MNGAPGIERVEESGLERVSRLALWALLLASWAVAVVYMWHALSSPTSGVEASGVVENATARTFFAAAVFSVLELGLVLAALWPWRPGFYLARLGTVGLAIITWIVMTTPLSVTRMDDVHRRWLGFMALAVAVAFILLAGHRLVRGLIRRRASPEP